jgi:hypothetical protein
MRVLTLLILVAATLAATHGETRMRCQEPNPLHIERLADEAIKRGSILDETLVNVAVFKTDQLLAYRHFERYLFNDKSTLRMRMESLIRCHHMLMAGCECEPDVYANEN